MRLLPLPYSAKRFPISNSFGEGRASWDGAAVSGKGRPMGEFTGGSWPDDGRAPGQSESTVGESAKSGPPKRPDRIPAGAGGHTQAAGRDEDGHTVQYADRIHTCRHKYTDSTLVVLDFSVEIPILEDCVYEIETGPIIYVVFPYRKTQLLQGLVSSPAIILWLCDITLCHRVTQD